MDTLFFLVSLVACLGCFVWGRHVSEKEAGLLVESLRADLRRTKENAGLSAIRWVADRTRYRDLVKQTPFSVYDLNNQLLLVKKGEQRLLVCDADSQLLWLRWNLTMNDQDIMDIRQFSSKERLIITTAQSGLPLGTSILEVTQRSSTWRLLAGDRLVYCQPVEPIEGVPTFAIFAFELGTDAAALPEDFSSDSHLEIMIDESGIKTEGARQAFAVGKSFGPPRTVAVNGDIWNLAA
jgi:hypothetical protein